MAEEGDFKVSIDKNININKCPVIYIYILIIKEMCNYYLYNI